ncbi:MAG: 23S rRNA (adenine(2503)-C(2))-methyltransferase RlmN [Pseudomonadota bacterium]
MHETTDSSKNLFALDRGAMESFFIDVGEKPFRAKQVMQWMYQRNELDIGNMTDLSKKLRERLSASTSIALPNIVRQQLSGDGTCKWLLELHDGNKIEMVYIPESDRGTLCVSSQVGCALNCTFCATARQGFNRNLTVDEIIGQVWVANRTIELLSEHDGYQLPAFMGESRADFDFRRPVTNVVMMGMGEPMLNLDSVIPAMKLMMDDFTFGLSRRRVTLSTSGHVPGIERLARDCPVSLAVSLHAPNDALRTQLVPLNKKYPIDVLLEACRKYLGDQQRQRITFEYVMLEDVNDSKEHALQLANILQDVPSKVNLIPFNSVDGIHYKCSSQSRINRFRDLLLSKNIFTVTRKTRGDDIDAACGQLAGQIQDRTRRSEKLRQSVVLS